MTIQYEEESEVEEQAIAAGETEAETKDANKAQLLEADVKEAREKKNGAWTPLSNAFSNYDVAYLNSEEKGFRKGL